MPESQKAFWRQANPVGRMGEAADVSQTILYLASDGASFVNGETMHLTGGLTWAP
jgi:NAD(P)-dependent dehydrogenase (short-subunit alcohol dehydrogenase family)